MTLATTSPAANATVIDILTDIIVDAALEPTGAPSGIIYLALQSAVPAVTLDIYQMLVARAVNMKLIRQRGDLLFAL